MRKLLFIIAIALCIFQMVVLAVDIDIGSAAIDRPATLGKGTFVDRLNPANASGKITSVEIYADTNLAGCEVATFYVVSGNNLSTRDTHYIGDVTAESKQTFSGLDIDVNSGDYIGIHYTGGTLDRTNTGGGDAYWYLDDTDAIPCTNTTFNVTSNSSTGMSLYGTGATVGWPHKWNTVTIGKWNTKEIMKWNDLE